MECKQLDHYLELLKLIKTQAELKLLRRKKKFRKYHFDLRLKDAIETLSSNGLGDCASLLEHPEYKKVPISAATHNFPKEVFRF